MSIRYQCDGCSKPLENPVKVGHTVKRDYCEDCAVLASEFVSKEEELRAAIQEKFVDDRASLIAQYSANGFKLPDVP
jgi:hypothetical protein